MSPPPPPHDVATAKRRLDDEDDAPLALLVVGETTVQSFALPARGAVVLGRAHDCDVPIADESVSRRHARLELTPLRIEDLGSANGTRVGAMRVPRSTPVELAPGDAFRLGSVTVFVQRVRPAGSGITVRIDAYFEARLAAECVRAARFALRFAVVALDAPGRAAELEAAVRAETRAADVVSIGAGGEARIVLVHTTREAAEALADRVCARLHGEVDVGVATYPDDGADPGHLLIAVRAHARPRVSGSPRERAAPVAEDAAMRVVLDRARRLAQDDHPVLLVGEDGVGKRTLAEWMHAQSKRARRPLVRVACDGMSEAQLEVTLFGEGDAERSGAIEAAHDGVLLLEHVDALSPLLEARLAHVLEHAQSYRVRSTTPRRVRVRVLATARRRVEREALRRLTGAVIEIPPLRARRGDIEALALRFVAETAAARGHGGFELAPDALDALRANPWPGNARALRIAIERAVAASTGAEGARIRASALELPANPGGAVALRTDVERLERERIVAALAAHGGNRSRAARALGIARNTLLARLRAYGLMTER